MSTDLEFRLDLLEIRIPAIKITSSQSSDVTDDDKSLIPIEKSSLGHEDGCQTPKSPQNLIPQILSCPPAPKKARPLASCKRKLCELQFFEMVAGEEVESFFRSSFRPVELKSDDVMKRRCLV
ncbi:unnamed protein product [Ilex paraguariensis]|uniref:Cyclin-dependent protein kinase inhibitor SMR1 n=1 Tax=Ilex paraguariensis TaxID=185542 RepID=A0ABC8U411_9AQUA